MSEFGVAGPDVEDGAPAMKLSRINASSQTTSAATYRYVMFGFIFLMYMISYADRAALSIALPALGQEFGLGSVQLGWISSSFLWSYFILNLPSSILLDTIGPRLTGVIAVALWSSAMVYGGTVSTIRQFIASRVFLGIGEAPTFGVGSSVVRAWALPKERGSVLTTLLTGQQIGLALGTLAGAFLIVRFGWRFEFAALGAIGLLWAAFWWFFYKDSPYKPVAEKKGPITRAQFFSLFRSRSFYAVVITQCLGNYFNFLVMSWLPVYFIHKFHQNVFQSGAKSAVCYVSASFGAILLGRFLETSVLRRRTEIHARRIIVCTCMVLSASVGLLPFMTSMSLTLVVMGVCLAGMIAGSGANTALLADLLDDGSKIGTVTGLTLTFSNLSGLFAPIVTGYIVAGTGSFDIAWFGCSGALVIAGLTSLFMVSGPIRTLFNKA